MRRISVILKGDTFQIWVSPSVTKRWHFSKMSIFRVILEGGTFFVFERLLLTKSLETVFSVDWAMTVLVVMDISLISTHVFKNCQLLQNLSFFSNLIGNPRWAKFPKKRHLSYKKAKCALFLWFWKVTLLKSGCHLLSPKILDYYRDFERWHFLFEGVHFD